MIVEFFGAPGAGKTTLARALATSLQSSGFDVRLIASSRPAELAQTRGDGGENSVGHRIAALAAPLSRGAKLLSALPALLPGARNDATVSNLITLLPPRRLLWSVRIRRYLTKLDRSWAMARASNAVVLFDQGFLSALSSLILLTRSADQGSVALGLALIPTPNVLIHVDAPKKVIEARLRERLRRQGLVERLFEFDLETSLEQFEVVSSLAGALREQGRPAMQVSCLDRGTLDGAVNKIVREVAVIVGDREPRTTEPGRRDHYQVYDRNLRTSSPVSRGRVSQFPTDAAPRD